MASIDYQGAKKEIESIFEKSQLHRKIVFWYDAPMNFKEDITNDEFKNCKLLVCEKNEFEIKKIIEHDDLDSNYLIYIPSDRPADQENWLLDILMYSDEYYADNVALTMRRLNISNSDLRKTIENHIKFFDSEARIKKLNSFISVNDETTADELKLAMMSTLVKANSNNIESVLTELVFDDEESSKYKELLKFGFENYLWNEICDTYNYDGDLKIDILIKRFIFTAFVEQTIGQNRDGSNPFENISSFHSQYLIENKGSNDAKFFIDRIKFDSRYEKLQNRLAEELKIEGLVANKEIDALQYTDIFEAVDVDIINKISASLVAESMEYDSFERIIMSRINSMWYKKHETEYNALLYTVRFSRLIESKIPCDLSANEYINKYITEYYLIDTFYRKAITYHKMLENPTQDFEFLGRIVETTYQTMFLDKIGKEYSKAIEKQGSWDFVGSNMSKDFYSIIQKNPTRKMFVIISDAMRYEVGKELQERIKASKVLNGNAEIDYMISPIPSVTSFGMASLLPHKSLEYENKQVTVDGLATDKTTSRDAVLKLKNKSYAAITYEEIMDMSRNELRDYSSDKSLVYIYHNVIDNAGEHNESKVFDVVDSCIDELVNLVKKLYNNLQISNFYITADHGFVYRKSEVQESEKYSNIVSLDALDTSKRYLITDDMSLGVADTLELKLNDVSNKKYKYITPWGYDLFKTQGAGLQYVHGGTSLQETIVPIVHISELRSREIKENKGPVEVRIKTIARKFTNRNFVLEFEQMEKVGDNKQQITCEAFIIDDRNEVVSNVAKFIANSASDDENTRIFKFRFTLNNIQFDRNKPYYLILKDADKDDEYIEKEQITLDIIQFKMF